jgi:hypothetical protein
MRVRKVILWCLVALTAAILLAAAALYMLVSWVPAEYRPEDIAHRWLGVRVPALLDEFAKRKPFQWEETQEQINSYLASMDEIVAAIPNRTAGQVNRELDAAGVGDPAVAIKDGLLTVMFLAKEYKKVVSVDLRLKQGDGAIRVRLAGTRVGRLPVPEALVRGPLGELKAKLQAQLDRRERDTRPVTRPADGHALAADVTNILPLVIAGIDESPIPTELPKWRFRIDEVRLESGKLTLTFSPLSASARKE